MTLIPKAKLGEFGLIDTAIITGSKILGERLLLPMVGNQSVKSGAVKGILAAVVANFGGKTGKLVATGMAVDATEDVLLATNPFNLFGGSQASASSAQDSRVRI